MNTPTIQFLAPERRSYAACPLVPEFKFTQRTAHAPEPPRYGPFWGEMPVRQGPPAPPMFTNPRKVHEPIKRDDRELKWMNQQPLSIKHRPLMEPGFVAPMGSLKGMDWWEAAIKKIERLTTQQERDAATHRVLIEQEKELPFITDEFRANGFDAISLSSSQKTTNDDETEAANFAEQHLGLVPYAFGRKGTEEIPVPEHIRFLCNMVGIEVGETISIPTYYNAEELVPVMRRIEWEQVEAKHSPIVKVRLIPQEDGTVSGVTTEPWMMRLIDQRTLMRLIVKIAKASGLTTADALEDARARVNHYGVIGSVLYGVKTGYQYPEQNANESDLGADEYDIPKKERHLVPQLRTAAFKAQGERELGLHGDLNDELVAELNAKGVLFVGHMPIPVTQRGHDDPFSFDSLAWEDSENGQPWVAPWPELVNSNV